ncbi:MAG: GNAT family N-acetyltransferase [Rickettsiales bacterium]
MQYKIKKYKYLHDSEYRVIDRGVYNHALTFHNFPRSNHFGFVAQDEEGQLIGGLYGATFYNSMKIDQLWVDEAMRHKGIGSELVKHAEELAREKDLDLIVLDTMTWEGPNFYPKLGFEVKGKIDGFAKGAERFIFAKKLK